MGDSAEFEKLGALEARLTAAFERIAKGVEARAAVPDIDAALTDAQARVAEAEAKAADLANALEAREGELADLRDALTAAEEKAAAEAEKTAGLQAEIEAAKAQTPSDAAALQARVDRARAERDAAIAARDAAEDRADELSQGGKLSPDERVMALRGEMRRLRNTVDKMSADLDALRSGELSGVEGVNEILQAQVKALKEARRAEAAELERIVALLSGGGSGPTTTTEGAKHA